MREHGQNALRRCSRSGSLEENGCRWTTGTEASSNATYLWGLSGSVVVSVMTYAHDVSEPVPAVVETAMCGGFFGFSLLLKPSNSLTLRPS